MRRQVRFVNPCSNDSLSYYSRTVIDMVFIGTMQQETQKTTEFRHPNRRCFDIPLFGKCPSALRRLLDSRQRWRTPLPATCRRLFRTIHPCRTRVLRSRRDSLESFPPSNQHRQPLESRLRIRCQRSRRNLLPYRYEEAKSLWFWTIWVVACFILHSRETVRWLLCLERSHSIG